MTPVVKIDAGVNWFPPVMRIVWSTHRLRGSRRPATNMIPLLKALLRAEVDAIRRGLHGFDAGVHRLGVNK